MQDVVKEYPLVSVLMPAHNAEQTIAEAVESILQQTYCNVELVVVNDGSTDGTATVLATYGDRIRVAHQSNMGLASARNAGCRLARGEFIALMDADDRCLPNRIAVQIAVAQQFSEVTLCCAEFSAFNSRGTLAKSYSRKYYSKLAQAADGLNSLFEENECVVTESGTFPVHLGHVYENLVFGNFLHPPTLLFPRSTLVHAGEFDVSLRNHADWEWIVRAARIGRVAFIDTPLLDYRISPTQRSSANRLSERAVDMFPVVNKIWAADIVFASRNREQRRVQLGRLCLEAADSICDENKTRAAKYLRESILAHRHLTAETLKISAKILLPRMLLQILRHLRGSANADNPNA